MKYDRLVSALASEPWAMQPEKLVAMTDFVRAKLAGVETKFTPAQDRKVAEKQGNVSLIPVYGVISQRMNMFSEFSGGTSTEKLGKQIAAAVNDPAIKAIVLDIDSPGGSVAGIPELSAMIHAYRGTKPIISQVNSLAASAGFWLASAADEIVVTPSGEVGSVGVYSLHEDISGMLEAEGVKETFIYAGQYKVEGNPFEPLSEEARNAMQARVNDYYDMFVSDLAKNRSITTKTVKDDFGQGRTFGAKEAVSRGMADRVGTLADTLLRFGANLYSDNQKQRASHFKRLNREADFIGSGYA